MTQPFRDAEDPAHHVLATLNLRDLQVLDGLAEGRSTARIASDLSISSNTARTRIHRLERKLEVTDRAAAVDAARELGVLEAS
jgi:LuxR family maltose regulon positive regulatory protein